MISELQAGQGKIDLTAEVIDKGDERTFEKFGKSGKVCNAQIKDESGEMKLTLWNEQADQVNVGDKIKITNGYVSEFQGEKQLSTGKFGQLEVVGKGDRASEAAPAQETLSSNPEAEAEEELKKEEAQTPEEPSVDETIEEEKI